MRNRLSNMDCAKRFLWIICIIASARYASAVTTDCERPPHVDDATVSLADDETGDLVSATYTCRPGFRLHGESELFCDLDTDEWQGEPPACRAVETTTSAPATSAETQRRRKPNNIQEDTTIDAAFARQLDLSCVGRDRGDSIRPPTIDNAYVAKYNRRKRDGNVFLVAFYECEENFDLVEAGVDHLYCSQSRWIGERPRCVSTGDTGDEYDDEDGEEFDEDEEEEKGEDEGADGEDANTENGQNNEDDEEGEDLPNELTNGTNNEVIDENEPDSVNNIEIVENKNAFDELSTSTTTTTTEVPTTTTTTTTTEVPTTTAATTTTTEEPTTTTTTTTEMPTSAPQSPVDEDDDEDDIDNEIDQDENEDKEEDYNDEYDENNESNDIVDRPKETSTKSPKKQRPTECAADRGGCDHACHMVYDDTDDLDGRPECSCFGGFTLDERDGRTCHDVDECAIDNGGCEQICQNIPGSVECSCHPGLQIETTNGRTCVDVNECLLRNGHGLCQDTCTNTFGSYACSCAGLPGTRLSDDGHRCEEVDECRTANGGCSHACLSVHGRIFCNCPTGYVIGSDFKTCKDINECHDPQTIAQCPHGCINTQGSYHCAPSPNQPHNPKDNEVYDDEDTSVQDSRECDEGLRADGHGECIDIDECAETDHGCENCRNIFGGFECYCSDGFELTDNGKVCQDINECMADEGDGKPSVCSHECMNKAGSFVCACPDNMHLQTDQRTCVWDSCADLQRANKTRCSHSCEDAQQGFQCTCPSGYRLTEDERTCEKVDICQEFHGYCEPGRCVPVGETFKCECPKGYNEKSKRCHDIDECEANTHNCSHDCVNEEGGFHCDCPAGLELDRFGSTCRDTNECDAQISPCGEDMVCVNTLGSYKCVCPEGMEVDTLNGGCLESDICADRNGGCSHICRGEGECSCPQGMRLGLDEVTCEVMNPCDVDNGGCSHECNRLDLSCGCPPGWRLDADGKRCVDIDECEENNGGCSHNCRNAEGSFICECREGFQLRSDGSNECEDIDECTTGNGGCSHLCINDEGSHHCSCPTGYSFDEDSDTSCTDIDECLARNGDCSHMCHNSPGAFHCVCPDGLYLGDDERTCALNDECEFNNGGCSHTCNFRNGAVLCSCPTGFWLKNETSCLDIDECATHNGGCDWKCENTVGGHRCLCAPGFELNRDGRGCSDIDECIEDNGNCSNICLNAIGSHSCECETGYRLSADNRTCADIDECEEIVHGCSHECRNTDGSYECGCPDGFQILDHFTCTDIDECAQNTHCVHGCVNTIGGFNCTCPDGHKLRADGVSCEDIDECSNNDSHHCSHLCINNVGGYECSCPKGYTLEADQVTCQDIDECTETQCSHGCENLPGSHRCTCPSGYHLSPTDHRQCVDINECHFQNGGCSHDCQNTDGSFKCVCPAGHHLQENGFHCQTDDLCVHANGGCEHLCTMVDGGVQCSCPNGFTINRSDNSTCIDVDECLQTERVCHQDCINVVGSYKCKCHRGYRMNERNECVDVDECERNNGGCGDQAKCVNMAGSYRCMCAPGFKLSMDKRSCVEIKDMCRPQRAPKNGDVKCSRSRHRTQLFYKTKCMFTCRPGYRLIGPAVQNCNGTGQWDDTEQPMCVLKTCPAFERPAHGSITPAQCLSGEIYSGERCILHCDPGYKPTDRRIAVCNPDVQWMPSANLTCTATLAIKPFIQCPPNATMVLTGKQRTMLIKMDRPKTNVDWWKSVESHPAWGKKLETFLPPGVHTVHFQARSPNSKAVAFCRTVITIKESRPPTVTFCPESRVIQLSVGEKSRAVTWQEPAFHSSSHLKEVFKSNIPGESFGPGEHHIKYSAVDQDQLSVNCEFNITVRSYFHPKRVVHHQGQRVNSGAVQSLGIPQPHHAQHRHPRPTTGIDSPQPGNQPQKLVRESYIMCPKSVMKVDTAFPIQVPPGCVLKHVKLPNYSHIRRRHSDTDNSMLRHYSSWDPTKTTSFAHQYRRRFD